MASKTLIPLLGALCMPWACSASGVADNCPPHPPTRLLMDLLSEPLALENPEPVMSWVVNDPDSTERQTAYEILIADSREVLDADRGTIWASGKVAAAESSSVVYAGPPLSADHVYFWKVRNWDKADAVGAYSQPQRFSTALKDRWVAKAIWGKSRQPKAVNDDFLFLRKSFDLPDKEIVQALAHVTALSPEPANQYVYQLRINGQFIGVGPPRGYTAGKVIPAEKKPSTRAAGVINRYNTFDVTEVLKSGRQNAIGALCYTTEDKRFLFQMTLDFADGTQQKIVSDETWKAFPAGNTAITNQGDIAGWFYSAPREGIDARHFPFGWDTVGFDDAAWQAADLEEPITGLTASATLNSRQYAHAPAHVVKKSDGHYYIDFGKARVAGLRLKLEGSAGRQVEIRFGEELDAPQTVRHMMRTGNKYHETWTLKDGPQVLQNWGYRVFRYAELLNIPEPFDASCIRAMELRQPFDDEASSFKSSDPMLNAVWDLCKYTIKANALDMYVDTHTRERINYEGGIFTEQISDYCVNGEYAFPRFSIEHPYYRPTWPTEGKQNSVMMAWTDYLYTGNSGSLRKHYQVLKQKTLEPFLNAGFLVEKIIDEGGQHGTYGKDMVDWPVSELDRFQFTPINTVINAFHCQAIADLAAIAGAIGETKDATRYAELAQKLRNAINAQLFDAAVGKFKDGRDATNHSIHSNAIPLSLGLVDPSHRESVANFIASRGMVGSVYLSQFLLDALYLNQRSQEALDIMTSTGLRSWGNMIQKLDATMTGEAWDPSIKRNMSFSHPWATAPANVITRGLFGIVPLEPGFSHFQIKPQTGSLQWAKLTTPSIKGPIHAEFTSAEGVFDMSVTVPVNTRATVFLPAAPNASVRINGQRVEGVIHQDFITIASVGSGRHTFVVDREK